MEDVSSKLNSDFSMSEAEISAARRGFGGKGSGKKSKRTKRRQERLQQMEEHSMDKPKKLEVQTDGDLSEVKKDPVWKTWLEKTKKKQHPEHPASENDYQTHINKPIHWKALKEVEEDRKKRKETEKARKKVVKPGDISGLQKLPKGKPSKYKDPQTMTKLNWRKPLKKRGNEHDSTRVMHPADPPKVETAGKPWSKYVKEPIMPKRERESTSFAPQGEGLGDKVEHPKDDTRSSSRPMMGRVSSPSGVSGPLGDPFGVGRRNEQPKGEDERLYDIAQRRDALRGSKNKTKIAVVKISIGRFGKKRRVWTDTGSKPTDIPDSKGNDSRETPKQTTNTSHETIARKPFKRDESKVREATPRTVSPTGLTGNKIEREGTTNPAMGKLEKPRKTTSAIENVNRAMIKLKRSLTETGEADNEGKKVSKYPPSHWKMVDGGLDQDGNPIKIPKKVVHPDLQDKEVEEKSPAPMGKRPYHRGAGGGFVHSQLEQNKIRDNKTEKKPSKDMDKEVTPSDTSAVSPPKEKDPKKRTNVPKADYFIEEIRANVLYHNKIAPLIGMVAGQVARGVATAGKKTLETGAKLGQEMGNEEREE